jgi:hypothetical protein
MRTETRIGIVSTVFFGVCAACSSGSGSGGPTSPTGCNLKVTGDSMSVNEACRGDWLFVSIPAAGLNTMEYEKDPTLRITVTSPDLLKPIPIVISDGPDSGVTRPLSATFSPAPSSGTAATDGGVSPHLLWAIRYGGIATLTVASFSSFPGSGGIAGVPHGSFEAVLDPSPISDTSRGTVTVNMRF